MAEEAEPSHPQVLPEPELSPRPLIYPQVPSVTNEVPLPKLDRQALERALAPKGPLRPRERSG